MTPTPGRVLRPSRDHAPLDPRLRDRRRGERARPQGGTGRENGASIDVHGSPSVLRPPARPLRDKPLTAARRALTLSGVVSRRGAPWWAESRPVEPDLGHTSEGSPIRPPRLPQAHRAAIGSQRERVREPCCRKLGEPASDPPAGTPRPQHHQLRRHGGERELPARARRLAGDGPRRRGGRGLRRDRERARDQHRHPVAALGRGHGARGDAGDGAGSAVGARPGRRRRHAVSHAHRARSDRAAADRDPRQRLGDSGARRRRRGTDQGRRQHARRGRGGPRRAAARSILRRRGRRDRRDRPDHRRRALARGRRTAIRA